MSIKSDKWITRKCNVDAVALLDKNLDVIKFLERELPVTTREEEALGQTRGIRKNPALSMIEPFLPEQVKQVENEQREKIRAISKGVTSYGYDVTLSDRELKIFTNAHACDASQPLVINPKKIDQRMFAEPTIHHDPEFGAYVLLPPHSYLLGFTVEYFRIPRNVLTICLGKSTYARSGIFVNVTPIEPGFEGNVVLEISNATSLPAMVYVNEGASQFCFFESDEHCAVSYADRGGKYQGQRGLVDAKV